MYGAFYAHFSSKQDLQGSPNLHRRQKKNGRPFQAFRFLLRK
jgi:hypothetical protein